MPDPLSKIATAMPRSLAGNHSETALVAAGQLPASPMPSINRAARNDHSPLHKACSMPDTDHHAAKSHSPAHADPVHDRAGDELHDRIGGHERHDDRGIVAGRKPNSLQIVVAATDSIAGRCS